MSEAQLTRPERALGGASVADTVLGLAAWSAAAQGLVHPVPRLHPLASGDQLAVLGGDYLDWVAGEPGRETSLGEWRRRIDQLRAAV
jgi:hypothetical protein